MKEIILWESNTETIHACDSAIRQALRELGLKATVQINAEPPLISRNELWDRLPVLEIENLRWSLHPGRAFTAEEVIRLFRRILLDHSRDRVTGEPETES